MQRSCKSCAQAVHVMSTLYNHKQETESMGKTAKKRNIMHVQYDLLMHLTHCHLLAANSFWEGKKENKKRKKEKKERKKGRIHF